MLVVNTCAFIDSAKQESIDAILEMARAQEDRRVQAAGRHRLPGRALPRRAASARSRRSTRCSAPAKCRTSSARSRGGAERRSADCRPAVRALLDPAVRRTGRAGEPPAARVAHGAADLHLRRRHAAAAGDAEALRLREDRRRLRLQVRVLHHPDAARRSTAAGRPTRSSARRARSRARGVKELLLISQDTTFYGIDRGERGALGRLLRRAERRRRPRVDPAALPLPDDDRRRRRSRRWPSARRSASTSTCRCSTRRTPCSSA